MSKKKTVYMPPVKKEVKPKFEKKHIVAIVAAITVLAIISVAVIYAVLLSQHRFEFQNGKIVEMNGREYRPVQSNFRAIQYESKDPYGTLDHPIFGKVPLYEVVGTNGGWLYCAEDEVLYILSSLSIPSFADMKPTSIIISTIGTRELSLKVMEDVETVEKYAEIIADENNAIENPGLEPDDTYRISFRSEDYPFLQYTVSYFEYGDSLFAIYDRYTDSYYPCGDEFYKLLQGADLETESAEVTPEP